MLSSADKASNNVIVVRRHYYINTAKTYRLISTDEKKSCNGIVSEFAVRKNTGSTKIYNIIFILKLLIFRCVMAMSLGFPLMVYPNLFALPENLMSSLTCCQAPWAGLLVSRDPRGFF